GGRWRSACPPGSRPGAAGACRAPGRARAPSPRPPRSWKRRRGPRTPSRSRRCRRRRSPGSAAGRRRSSPRGRRRTPPSPVAQAELHHDGVLAGAVVAAAKAELAEAEAAVETTGDDVAGTHLEVDDPRPGAPCLADDRLEQQPPEATPAPLGMDGDVQQVHLVGHAPAAAVADHGRPEPPLFHGHGQPREGSGELLLEEGARPGLGEGAALDLEHGHEILAPHLAERDRPYLLADRHGRRLTTASAPTPR